MTRTIVVLARNLSPRLWLDFYDYQMYPLIFDDLKIYTLCCEST